MRRLNQTPVFKFQYAIHFRFLKVVIVRGDQRADVALAHLIH